MLLSPGSFETVGFCESLNKAALILIRKNNKQFKVQHWDSDITRRAHYVINAEAIHCTVQIPETCSWRGANVTLLPSNLKLLIYCLLMKNDFSICCSGESIVCVFALRFHMLDVYSYEWEEHNKAAAMKLSSSTFTRKNEKDISTPTFHPPRISYRKI